jgi:hypothetical protein
VPTLLIRVEWWDRQYQTAISTSDWTEGAHHVRYRSRRLRSIWTVRCATYSPGELRNLLGLQEQGKLGCITWDWTPPTGGGAVKVRALDVVPFGLDSPVNIRCEMKLQETLSSD